MKSTSGQLLKKIFNQAKPYWFHMAVLFLLSLLATPIALLQPYAIKLIVDSGFGSTTPPGWIRWIFPSNFTFSFNKIILIAALLVILIALIDNIVIFISWLLSTYIGEKLVLNFRTTLFNHIQRLSLSYHDTKGTSDSLYRIQWDTMCIRQLLLAQLTPLISAFITLFAMIGVMFSINWRFALIALSLTPCLIILTKLSTNKLKKDWYKVKDAESNAMSVIHEVLSSLRIVKSFGQEESENDRFTNRSNTAVQGQIKLARTEAGYSFVVGIILAIGTALFIYVGATFVHAGQITLGELILVMAYLTQIFGPLQSIVKNLNEIQSSMSSIDRVFSVLDEVKEIKENAHALSLTRTSGRFMFEHVSFSYVGGKPTLKDISFQVEPGDRVGIMGSTGAGKSTIVSLLMRFYDPGAGTILIDNTDIRDYRLADYRKQFSIVLQEPVLFSTTIKENIRYGRPGATDEEIIQAAKLANAHNFIINHKDGYDMMVGERGMQLSGGERQRISIARAFIKNAPVLILDEPTSSLDSKTEALVMEATDRLMEDRTTFMITHRLDTLQNCNLILHFENGKLLDLIRDNETDFLVKKKKSFLNS